MNNDNETETVIHKTFLQKISDKVHEFVGSWAYFIGNVMADGYIDRMTEFYDEDEDGVEVEVEIPGDKKDFGAN